MIYLASTSDKLQVVTSSANAVNVHATFMDLSGTTVTPGLTNTSIAAATTTDVVASPGASTTRKIKFLSVFNDHATAAQNIVIRHTDGTITVDFWAGSVAAQTGVTFDEKFGWRVSAPFPAADIQTFDFPGGTWTKPTGPRTGLTLIRLWSGGGGGGGGASLATAAVAKGGSGGGGGVCFSRIYLTDELPDTLRVVIGLGGAGGAGGAAGAAGGAPTAGTASYLRSASPPFFNLSQPGGAGTGGQITATATTGGGGSGIHGTNIGTVSGSAASFQPASGSTSSAFGPAWEGGGGGGGSDGTATVPLVTAGGTARFGGGGGGSGGCHSNVPANVNATAGGGTGNSVGATASGLGGAAGTSGASPTAGANGIDTDGIVGGTGGGGGGTTVTASTAGRNGGNGGKGGGGGGGGGVGMNPGVGGRGGNGGNGYGIIISW